MERIWRERMLLERDGVGAREGWMGEWWGWEAE
jgi:hypothetical protein